MTQRISAPVLLLLLLLLLAACAPSPSSSPAAAASSQPSSVAAAFPLTLTDDAGREVTLEAEPQRIVSLAPSNTEIVCAIDACDRLVGVTDFDDYPADVVEVDKVVTMAQVDVEAVVATEPDLVLAAGNELTPTAVIEQLADLGVPVVVLYPESLDDVSGNIELVGRATGRNDEAAALVGEIASRAEAVEQAVADLERPRTFYEVSVFEGTIYTAGERSFLASLIETAGGEPVTGDALSTS
ncbi:MAG: ABC transporter substrate-binding protein, partial [Chloroflexi bacterium]|nr:ABC transporter substrate-binding protein [Chloroflexota bacterium]